MKGIYSTIRIPWDSLNAKGKEFFIPVQTGIEKEYRVKASQKQCSRKNTEAHNVMIIQRIK